MSKFKPYEIGASQDWTLNILDMLPKSHVVFFVEDCVSKLDTSKIESSYSCLGPHAYHPKMLLSILFYGYMQGIRSGRQLATACSEQIPFIYLSKGYFPKKTVINSFRQANVEYFKDYFEEFIQLFDQESRSATTSIFDGSKIGANASRFQSREKATYERWLVHLEEDIGLIEKALQQEADADRQASLQVDLTKKKNCELKSAIL